MGYHPVRQYNTRCSVCQFMKKNPRFRERIYNSTYFDKDGFEAVQDICADFPGGPAVVTVYRHIKQNHLDVTRERKIKLAIEKLKKDDQEGARQALLASTGIPKEEGQELLESITTVTQHTKDPYIRALDAYIRQAEDEVLAGRLKITASSFLAAVKIKADIEKHTKDRSLDVLKTLAGYAAPGAQSGAQKK